LKQPDAAVTLGARAYALAPMNPLATASYGAFLARAGRAGEAVPLLEKAVAMAPGEARFAQELKAARGKVAP
jgi:predicted Zn-dependent protease